MHDLFGSDDEQSALPSPSTPPVSAPPSPLGDEGAPRTSRLSVEDQRRVLLHLLASSTLIGVTPSDTAFVASEVWHNSVTLHSYEGPKPGPRPATAASEEKPPPPPATSSGGPRQVDLTTHMGPGVSRGAVATTIEH
eukprot:1078997-Pleurochrysis_carterae.AAC.1